MQRFKQIAIGAALFAIAVSAAAFLLAFEDTPDQYAADVARRETRVTAALLREMPGIVGERGAAFAVDAVAGSARSENNRRR